VLAPDGKLLHAEREARDDAPRDALREAAVRIDRARTRRAASDPDEAASLWRALVDARWSLVERFESDGRRFLVARRNDPTSRASKALTERERKVVALTALGHPLKVAAYELGLSESTVSLTLRTAMEKMGVPTRAALVELHGAIVRDSERA
jgi:DNA-binding NarL/FixJ family response regulator